MTSFQWFKNGVQIAGEVQKQLWVQNVTHSVEGTYFCRMSNLAGHTIWGEVVVMVL